MEGVVVEDPCLPRYGAGCISDLMPILLGLSEPTGPWFPSEVVQAERRVLVVLDGLGWEQLQAHRDLAPTLAEMSGGPITTVAPSTTAAALTSITTGLSPGEHGVIGYRMVIDHEVLNCLRWGTPSQPDARRAIPPDAIQPFPPFLGRAPALVSKAEFLRSGFTQAHLRGGRLTGYRMPSTMVAETGRLLREGERFVYAYYDGIDKVAHEYGFADPYRAEVRSADRLVADLIDAAPAGTAVLVTADHGHVDCGDRLLPLHREVRPLVEALSGEGRFRWLHAKAGRRDELLAATQDWHGQHAWVRSVDQIVDEGWFGPRVRPEVLERVGDVALCPIDDIAFADPDDTGPFQLVGRHGSLTTAEMLVPCISAVA
jgi:predicted AlkP superfamily pyrophosphatase or phosphodiesterase